jgi:probable phosphoglycerate mutase
VYASDLPRARETAELIAAGRGLTVKVSAGLRERSFGVLEGKTLPEAARISGSWFLSWQADRLLKSPPDGETQPEMSQRVMEVVRRIFAAHPGKSVAIAGHGGPIKSAVYHVLSIPLSLWDLTFIANGSITTLRGTPDVMRVVTVNDICHLQGLAAGPAEAVE